MDIADWEPHGPRISSASKTRVNALMAQHPGHETAPMVIVPRNGRVNRIPYTSGNRRETWLSAFSRPSAPPTHLRAIHRDS
jgi:hypothetical protein